MERTLSSDDPHIGWLLNRLARTQDLGGDQQAAEASLDRALLLADQASRPAAFLRAETLTNQARLRERFEPDRAVGIYEKACERYRRLAPDALEFADCLADLGRLLRWLDRSLEANDAESQANVIYAKHAWAQSRRSLKAQDR